MQSITFIVLLVFAQGPVERKDEWRRILTLDDSAVEMNVSNAVAGDDHSGIASFRIQLAKPEQLPGQPAVKYRTVVETVEFECRNGRYRPIEYVYFDTKGKQVHSEKHHPPLEWKTVGARGMMSRLFEPACKLIEETRRNQ